MFDIEFEGKHLITIQSGEEDPLADFSDWLTFDFNRITAVNNRSSSLFRAAYNTLCGTAQFKSMRQDKTPEFIELCVFNMYKAAISKRLVRVFLRMMIKMI